MKSKEFSIPCLPRIYIISRYWIFLNAFSAIDMIRWILFFRLLVWWFILIYLWMLSQLCIPGLKPTWLWGICLSKRYRIQFANILLKIFPSMFLLFDFCYKNKSYYKSIGTKTIWIYHLIVLKVRSLKWVLQANIKMSAKLRSFWKLWG